MSEERYARRRKISMCGAEYEIRTIKCMSCPYRLQVRVDEIHGMQEVQRLEELTGKVPHAIQWEGTVVMALEEVVQTRSKALKDQAVMTGR